MRTVAAAIKEDLGRVKDALDLYTRKGGPPEELAPQVDLLQEDRRHARGAGPRLRARAGAGRARAPDRHHHAALAAEQDTLIAIAATLIGVEDGLDDALVRLIMPPGAPAPGAETDPEFRQVTESVLRECIVNLARIKELLGHALDPTTDQARARRGARARARHHRRPAAARPQSRDGSHAAHRRARVVAARARAAFRATTSTSTGWRTRSSASSTTWRRCRRVAAIPGTCSTTPSAAWSRWTRCAATTPRAAEPAQAPRSRAAGCEAANRARDATERRPAVDPELLSLFIEEAGEEIATIGRLFPLWAENPSDRESLTRVRRAFHTLKGSGRVVGARRIGDFAWSVENLLNRVIDGTLDRSSGMLATLREAIATAAGARR